MRDLPTLKLFSSDLIDDMHKAFEVPFCSNLGLRSGLRGRLNRLPRRSPSWREGERTLGRTRCGSSRRPRPAGRRFKAAAANDPEGSDRTISKSIPVERLNANNSE